MKTIYIVRHAKSSWEYEGIEDIDRPLKKRGIKDAYLIANVLKDKIARPEKFISSCATRAMHTAVIFANVFKYPMSHLQLSKSLYSFSDGYLIKTIKALDDELNHVIIFSHDHGISDFVNHYGSETIEHVPTAGVVGIQFNVEHWKNISEGITVLQEFPKYHKAPKAKLNDFDTEIDLDEIPLISKKKEDLTEADKEVFQSYFGTSKAKEVNSDTLDVNQTDSEKLDSQTEDV